MDRGRWLTVVMCIALATILAGCSLRPSWLGGGAAPSATGDSAGRALAAAREVVDPMAPGAVTLMVSSTGAERDSAPDQWRVTFASTATGRTYAVDVVAGQASAPRDTGALKLTPDVLANAIPYDALKIGSGAAYAKAKAELAATGGVPSRVHERLALVDLASLPNLTPAVWEVSFSTGVGAESTRTAYVDAVNGAVTTTPTAAQ